MTKHPNLLATTVRCTSCGTTFTTRSTRAAIVVEVCSNCHPAYTGRAGTIAGSHRIENFNRRRARARAAA